MWKDNLLTIGALLVLIIHPSQSFIEGVCNGVRANDQVCQRPEKGNKYNDILIQAKENNLKNNIGLTETRVILSRYHLGTENSRIYRERSSKDSSGIREFDRRQTSRAPTTSARNSRYMISHDGQTQRQIDSQIQLVTRDLTNERIDTRHSRQVRLPEARTERANINNIRLQRNQERLFTNEQLRRNNARELFLERAIRTRDVRQYDSFSERISPERRENNVQSTDRNQRVNLSNRRETREISHTNRRNDRMNYRNNRKNIDHAESNRQTMSFRQKVDEHTSNQHELSDQTSSLRSGDRRVKNAINERREIQVDQTRQASERDVSRTIRNKRDTRTTEILNSENILNGRFTRMNENERLLENNRDIRVLRSRDNSGVHRIDSSERRTDFPKKHDSRNDLIQDRTDIVRERQLTRNTGFEQRKNIDTSSRRSVDILTVRSDNKRQEDTERRHIGERRNNLRFASERVFTRNNDNTAFRRDERVQFLRNRERESTTEVSRNRNDGLMRLDRKSENRLQNPDSRNLRVDESKTRRDITMRKFSNVRFDRETENRDLRNLRTDTRNRRDNMMQRFTEMRSDREVENRLQNLESRNRRVDESQRDNTMRKVSKTMSDRDAENQLQNRNLNDQRIDETRIRRDNTMRRFAEVRSDREVRNRLQNLESRNRRIEESSTRRDNIIRRFSKASRTTRDLESQKQNRNSDDRRIDETVNRRDNTIQRVSNARSNREVEIRLQNREFRIIRVDESSIQQENAMRRFSKARSDRDVENRRIDATRNRRDNTMHRFSKSRSNRDIEYRLQNRETNDRIIDETRNRRNNAMQRFSEMNSDRQEDIQRYNREFRNLRVDESRIRRSSNERSISQNRLEMNSQESLIRDSRDRQVRETMRRITPLREVSDRSRMSQERATSRLVSHRDIGNMQLKNRISRRENNIQVREIEKRTQRRDSKRESIDRVLIDARNIRSQEMNLDSRMRTSHIPLREDNIEKSSHNRNSVRKDTVNIRSREINSESRVRAVDTSRRAVSTERSSNDRLLVQKDANNIRSNKLDSRNRFLDASSRNSKEHFNAERNIRVDTVRQFQGLSNIPTTFQYDISTMKLFQGVNGPSMGDIAIQLLKTLSICSILIQIMHSYKESNPKFGFSKIFQGIGHTLKLKAN